MLRFAGVRAVLVMVLALTGCQQRSELVIFHATSLSSVFGELADRLKQDQPKLNVRLEPSGSQVAARKVAEHGLRADLVAVADDAILQHMLVPQYAPRSIVFATNELVLAHMAHSKGTAEISPGNWPEVLAREGVRLGRVNEDLAPLGYHTLLGWQLAEKTLDRPGLAARLHDACAKEHVTNDEAELLALLEAKAIDYAFLYRSTAEDHRLEVTTLPDAANLSRIAEDYSRASVEISLRTGDPKTRVHGRPITYGLVVLANAPNAAAAKAFVDALTSDEGRKALERHGFSAVKP